MNISINLDPTSLAADGEKYSMPRPNPKKAAEAFAIGHSHFHQGNSYLAMEMICKAILLDPDDKKYKIFFSNNVNQFYAPKYSPSIKNATHLCLQEHDLVHRHLPIVWMNLVLQDPDLKPLLSLYNTGGYKDFCKSFKTDAVVEALNDDFVLDGLNKLLLNSIEFETLFTRLRRYILLGADEDTQTALISFLAALAQNCFFNEYIFDPTKEEEEKTKELHDNHANLDVKDILLLACYEPLFPLEHAEKLGEALRSTNDQDCHDVAEIMIEQPLEEVAVKKTIPTFGTIEDHVSQKVQNQYEENPYPRWLHYGHRNPLPGEDPEKARDIDILIAGCGTGQQSAMMGMTFPYSTLTAIDLSLASLAYAKRQSQKYGLNRINYMHGDLLQVAEIGKTFELIACGGVLHHMKSPEDGLKALLDVLKPGGLMRLGLYSEIARQGVVKVREWEKQHNFPRTIEGIRAFRKEIVAAGKRGEIAKVCPNYSASICRDTYLHEQEHRFTCLTLKEMLDRLGLRVLSFTDGPRGNAYKQDYIHNFPEDPYAVNLENWHKWEQETPLAFIAMYQFLVGRKEDYTPDKRPEWWPYPTE